jgi:hypothetical protein
VGTRMGLDVGCLVVAAALTALEWGAPRMRHRKAAQNPGRDDEIEAR